jgi:hypothetical protein
VPLLRRPGTAHEPAALRCERVLSPDCARLLLFVSLERWAASDLSCALLEYLASSSSTDGEI